jgi:hypothetical protein
MTSFRQIEANRRNALKSTGPKTQDGKRPPRRNAVRHCLTAETVIEGLEDAEVYLAFEATIISDYDAETVVECELVLLASLLWRMRRAISIETDLLRIQGEILRDRRNDFGPAGHLPERGQEERVGAQTNRCERLDDPHDGAAVTPRALTYCFLRLGNLDNGTSERLGRYHAALWKQTAQALSCFNRPDADKWLSMMQQYFCDRWTSRHGGGAVILRLMALSSPIGPAYRRAAAPRTARLSEVGARLALVPFRAISMSWRCLRVATRASDSMAR